MTSPPIGVLLYSDAEQVGGAETALANLLAAFSDDIRPVVAGVDDDVIERVVAGRPETPTCRLPPIRSKRDLRAISAHARLVLRTKADIFHANLTWPASCRYGLSAAFLRPGLRVVAVEQLPMPVGAARFEVWRRIVARRAAGHVAVGDANARTLEAELRLPSGSVWSIHNGVPDVHVDAADRSGPTPVVMGVGRLEEYKGFGTLLHAASHLDVRVVLAGDGPDRERLSDLARSLGMADRVTITGWIDDVRPLVAAADVMVLASSHEGFPLSIVEAMLSGTPVVATDVGSVSEAVVDGVTGRLVRPGDIEQLRDAIAWVLDGDRAALLGRAARARAVERFTASVMAARFESLYRRVLGR